MTSANSETIDRLMAHAGFGASGADLSRSVSACIDVSDGLIGAFDAALADLFTVLEQLNIELNGADPSRSGARENCIPRQVAYSIAEMSRLLREVGAQNGALGDRKRALDAAWAIETAWTAVLAGDITSIQEHLELERRARF